MSTTEPHYKTDRQYKAAPQADRQYKAASHGETGPHYEAAPHDGTTGAHRPANGDPSGNNPPSNHTRGKRPDMTRGKPLSVTQGQRPDIVWFGPYYTPVGYGEENRNLICALYHRGFSNLRIIPSLEKRHGLLTPEQEVLFGILERNRINPGQSVVVQHCTPDAFRSYLRGRVNIGRTMFETDRIPFNWVERCKQMDEIWVPSHFNIETFSNSGVPRHRLRAVPGGVNVNAFHPAAPPLPVQKRGFTFLANFGWVDRKGWDLLLKAYCYEFKPGEEVTLVIKTFAYLPVQTIELQYNLFIQRLNLPHPAPATILINSSIPVGSMPGLYTACDAFVLPSRGEGWGLPYLEAMACGLPVIGTRWSGNLDFMNDDNSYLIEIEGLEDVPANVDMPVYCGHRWAKPSLDHLRQLLRHVYEHRQEARGKGERARADVCERWSWEQVAATAQAELQKFGVS